MRLWHYKIIPYLPNSQLIAQWRELNTIFVKQPNHILINYIYEYSKDDLFSYTMYVLTEMNKRKFNINNWYNFNNYFDKTCELIKEPFNKHHNHRYLLQCFYNLQEKYYRGQKDFSKEQYKELEEFIKNQEKLQWLLGKIRRRYDNEIH